MSDFETHPIGTAKEVRLSRNLANELIKVDQTNLPEPLLKALSELQAHYNWQMETEYL